MLLDYSASCVCSWMPIGTTDPACVIFRNPRFPRLNLNFRADITGVSLGIDPHKMGSSHSEGRWIVAMMNAAEDPRAGFIDACVWHGPLDRAEAILIAHPEIASSDIHTAAL